MFQLFSLKQENGNSFSSSSVNALGSGHLQQSIYGSIQLHYKTSKVRKPINKDQRYVSGNVILTTCHTEMIRQTTQIHVAFFLQGIICHCSLKMTPAHNGPLLQLHYYYYYYFINKYNVINWIFILLWFQTVHYRQQLACLLLMF